MQSAQPLTQALDLRAQQTPFPILEGQKARIERSIEATYFSGWYKTVLDVYEVPPSHEVTLKERVVLASGMGSCISDAAFYLYQVVRKIYRYVVTLLWGRRASKSEESWIETIALANEAQIEKQRKWRRGASQEKGDGNFESSFLEGRVQLRQFTCPITEKLILCPYRTKEGQVFERIAITSWLQKRKRAGEATFYNEETIQETDLFYDWKYYPRLYRHLEESVNTEGESAFPEAAREEIMAFQGAIKKHSAEIFERLRSINAKMNIEGRISDEELERRDREVMKHYRLLYPRNQENGNH